MDDYFVFFYCGEKDCGIIFYVFIGMGMYDFYVWFFVLIVGIVKMQYDGIVVGYINIVWFWNFIYIS